MAQPESPGSREFRQMRHDVDDCYRLLTDVQQTVDSTREVVGTILAAQRRHDRRFEEIQQSLDRQAARMDATEDDQRQQFERLGRFETRLDGVDRRLGRVEGLQQEQGERLGRVEGLQQEQGERLGRMEDIQQHQGEQLAEILTLLRGRPSG